MKVLKVQCDILPYLLLSIGNLAVLEGEWGVHTGIKIWALGDYIGICSRKVREFKESSFCLCRKRRLRVLPFLEP